MNEYINEIIKLAKKAKKKNEVPVGCIIVNKNNKIIAKSYNKRNKTKKVINHAEILCILKASSKIKDWRLDNYIMYVTLKPCKMCEEIIKQSRIEKVYYLLDSTFNNEIKNKKLYEKIISNREKEYKEIISNFFIKKR